MGWRSGGQVERVVAAPADELYAAITDIASVGSRSDECHTAHWLPGSSGPAVGARFVGRNRHRLARWSRTCEVVEAEPGRTFAFRTVPERLDLSRADSTLWRYELTEVPGGTLVRHSYEITQPPLRPFRAVYGVLLPQHKDMRPSMQLTLERLAQSVGATA